MIKIKEQKELVKINWLHFHYGLNKSYNHM